MDSLSYVELSALVDAYREELKKDPSREEDLEILYQFMRVLSKDVPT